ncbi:hypothetical protein XA1314C_00730 [Xanthomonas arboricola]|uniref:Uncharacterized protein n=1 Tax=Xanthomonas arboricola TaxID=56448 RepID=A0AAU9HLJ0_9XANT|nr:hypothetical protein XA1314C_00730 [Xanthomonas arboricola]CAE6687006.1 hypothetical protein XA1314C_00730 [Xanthomonas arboricola]
MSDLMHANFMFGHFQLDTYTVSMAFHFARENYTRFHLRSLFQLK